MLKSASVSTIVRCFSARKSWDRFSSWTSRPFFHRLYVNPVLYAMDRMDASSSARWRLRVWALYIPKCRPDIPDDVRSLALFHPLMWSSTVMIFRGTKELLETAVGRARCWRRRIACGSVVGGGTYVPLRTASPLCASVEYPNSDRRGSCMKAVSSEARIFA